MLPEFLCDSEVAFIRPIDPMSSDLFTFLSSDLQGIYLPRVDPRVVTLTIVNFAVKRVLIDTGSSSKILFTEAFDQFEVSRDGLRPVATPLFGFNRSTTKSLGIMELLVLMGTHPQQASTLVNFVVVEASPLKLVNLSS